jgi:hypothetical protein
MIDNVVRFIETPAEDIVGIAQVVGHESTYLIQRLEGMTAGYISFRLLESDKTITIYKSTPLRVVINVQSWDDLTVNDLIDIELDLMLKGAI